MWLVFLCSENQDFIYTLTNKQDGIKKLLTRKIFATTTIFFPQWKLPNFKLWLTIQLIRETEIIIQ